jgi:small subunit ribosomal protein S17
MKEMNKKKIAKKVTKNLVGEAPAQSKSVSTRGRTFEGIVTRKFPKRITIELERTLFIKKYERFAKKKTRIHARLPDEIEEEIQIGDLVQVRECRPLSKIIHTIVVKKIRGTELK